MERLSRLPRKLDAFQQRHAVLAFSIAVFKKYGDDRGNNYVALLTYFGFLSLFPLLLLLLTATEMLLASYPGLRETILQSTLKNFPVLADTLEQNIQALSGAWFRIALGSAVALLAAFGVANTIRDMIDDLWQIPRVRRRGMPWNYLTNLGIILIGGLILAATGIIAGWLTRTGSLWYFMLATAINSGLFMLSFRIATSAQVKTKNLLLQSVLTAVAWQILQVLGSYLVERQLNNLNLLYGSFAVVLGLLFWLYMIARVVVYAVEVDVVLERHLWPRSITGDITNAGKNVYTGYVKAEKRHRRQDISVRFPKKPTRQPPK